MVTARWERGGNYVVLAAFAISVLLPVVGLLMAALSPSRTGSIEWGHVSFNNFRSAWTEGNFSRYIGSSVVISVSVVLAVTLLCILSGYAFGVIGVPGEKILFPLVLAGIMVPLEAIIVPLYFNLRGLGLTNTYPGLILAHTGLSIGFGTFWMRSYFRSFPRSLIEAGELDGASTWKILWRILVPSGRPAIMTMVLLIFMWTWNDYFLALVLTSGSSVQPATLALGAFQGRYTTEVNLLAASAVIISIPVVLLYLFFQRQFIKGVLAGAVKE